MMKWATVVEKEEGIIIKWVGIYRWRLLVANKGGFVK